MEVVFECRVWTYTETYGSISITFLTGEVTNYSGDFTDVDMALMLYYSGNRKWRRLGQYIVTNGTWQFTNSTTSNLYKPLDFVLVPSSKYPGWEEYSNIETADIVAKYQCRNLYGYLYRVITTLSSPTGLTHDQVTSTSARVGWNAVTNASDYKVEYRVQGATNWTED